MRWLIIAFCLALAAVAQGAGTTSPAGADRDKEIAAAIAQLGDDSFEAREKATKYLWSLGVAAEPALREAAKGTDPEVSRRAGEILDGLRYGLEPGKQQDVLAMLRDYAGQSPAEKKETIDKLCNLGNRAIGPALRLLAGEREAGVREQLLDRMVQFGRASVALCLALDEPTTAQAILERGGHLENGFAIQNQAAFFLLRGGLDERIAELRQRNDTPPALMQAMLRAKGDFAAALKCQPDGLEVLSILWDMKDWKNLAQRQERTAGQDGNIDSASSTAAFWWLAHNDAQLARAIEHWKQVATQQQGYSTFTGRGLLLLDRVDDGMATLKATPNSHEAIALLALQYRFDELLALVDQAEQTTPQDLREVRLEAARCLFRAGEGKQAGKFHDAVIKADDGKCDGWAWQRLITVELAMNRRAEALAHAIEAVHAAGDEPFSYVVEPLFPENSAAAEVFYRALRKLLPDEKEHRTMERVEEALAGKAAAQDLEQWAAEGEAQAFALPVDNGTYLRDARLDAIAATLLKSGREQAALKLIEKLADASDANTGQLRAGDYFAQKKDYAQAATWYGRAWGKDRSSPKAAWLYGWALSQAGQEKEGRRLMDLATLLPLAEDGARAELAAAMESQGATDAAREQRQIMLRLASWDSHDASVFRRRLAGELCDKGDSSSGVEMWRQGLVALFHSSTSFVDPTAYLIVPRDMHRIQGDALLAAGKADEAMAQYRLCQKFVPSDVNLVIEVAPKLEKAGREADADKLYAFAMAAHDKALGTLPKAAMIHNDLAWLGAKCRRDLDKALEHARTASELEPTSAAILDTLAETRFVRGEKQEAIATIQRAIAAAGETNPIQKYLHEQLKRFETGEEKAPK